MAKQKEGGFREGRVWLSRMIGGKAEGVWQSEGWVEKQKEGG